MTEDRNRSDANEASDSFTTASRQAARGWVAEFFDFLKHNKRWWLVPMILVLLLIGGMIVLTNTAILPAFYMLF